MTDSTTESPNTDDLPSLVQPQRSLSPRERSFALRYVEDYDIKETAKSLNISTAVARKMLRNVAVVGEINKLQNKLSERSLVNADFVRYLALKQLPRLEGEEDIPIVDRNGDTIMARKYHAPEVLRMIDLLGKSTRFYESPGAGAGQVNLQINFGALGITEPKDVNE